MVMGMVCLNSHHRIAHNSKACDISDGEETPRSEYKSGGSE